MATPLLFFIGTAISTGTATAHALFPTLRFVDLLRFLEM